MGSSILAGRRKGVLRERSRQSRGNMTLLCAKLPKPVTLVCTRGEALPGPGGGRVEGWRGVVAVPASFAARGYLRSRRSIRLQPPPRRTQHAGFLHYALLIASRQGLCGQDWPSPCRISPPSGLAAKAFVDKRRPSPSDLLSWALCLPVLEEESRSPGLLRSSGVTRFHRYYEPIRLPLAVG